MIKPLSLVADYTLIWSGDPALKLPEDPAEREKALEVAQETSRWDDLILEGQMPTLFEVRNLTGSALAWWRGESNHSSLHRRPLTVEESSALALRLAVRKVTNLGDYKIRFERGASLSLATTELIDQIYAAAGSSAFEVMLELANTVIRRSEASPSPK